MICNLSDAMVVVNEQAETIKSLRSQLAQASPVQHAQPAIALLQRWHRAYEDGAGTISVAEDTRDFLEQQQASA